MQTISHGMDLRRAVADARAAGKAIGLVPTMGALHEGHLSLMRRAREETDFVVVSIFVNPSQFGPHEDLDTYPRDLAKDARAAAEVGVDAVFAPSVEEMYPTGFASVVRQESLTRVLEGEFRPGHFDGVCTICIKLFNVVQPDIAYFGLKDYQQALAIKRVVRDLDAPLEIRTVPIVREPDGLAMSSRNRYLSPEERRQALCLFRALRGAEAMFAKGERESQVLREAMAQAILREPQAKIDYVAVKDAETLEALGQIRRKAVALLAVRIGATRLIDNMLLEPTPQAGTLRA